MFKFSFDTLQKQSPWRCSAKKLLFEISQNSQENTCAKVSVLISLQAKICNKKETLVQVFSFEFCKISKNTFSYIRRSAAASYFGKGSFVITIFCEKISQEFLFNWANLKRKNEEVSWCVWMGFYLSVSNNSFAKKLRLQILFPYFWWRYQENINVYFRFQSRWYIPDNIYWFKITNRNTGKRCEICSKLTIKTSKRRQ